MKTGKVLLLFFLFWFSFQIVAKPTGKARRTKQKRVVINFQDELLKGNPSNPGVFNLFQKKEINYGRLIEFRKNFLPEMRRTAKEL